MDRSPFSNTQVFESSSGVNRMATHVYNQAQLLLLDISAGCTPGDISSRLTGIEGAIREMEALLDTRTRIGDLRVIQDPGLQFKSCNRCMLREPGNPL